MTKQQTAKATPAFFGAGHEYLFYIEGLNREVWFKQSTERLAHAGVWQSLTNEEQDAVVQIECLDEREVEEA